MDTGPGALVRAAAQGDQAAWDALVDRFAGLVWSVARAHRLDTADAADVSQTTWLRLVEHLDRLRDPDRVAGWLATTARNECLRVLRRAGRQVPTGDDHDLDVGSDPEAGPDLPLLTAERDRALWHAFSGLPVRCQALLRLLMADPPPAYEEIGELLGMPIGSIGPTRGRCLENLRHRLAGTGITTQPTGSLEQGG
jgi:RNA polymerase sigma factor (sigma-70 family)